MNILEFYGQHREELEVISDEQAVFLLAFISNLGNASLEQLATHLGWNPHEIATTLQQLSIAGFISTDSREAKNAKISISSAGRDVLRVFGLLDTVLPQKRAKHFTPVTQPTNIYAETAPSGLFDTFLLWLSSDRDLAVKRHDEIMRKMIKYFTRRAYSDPEELAAETRERVARIINSNREYPNHEALFYSVAQKVWHEAVRKPKPESLVLAADFGPLVDQETEHKELQARCLERCLAKLPASERDLISRYFLGRGVDQTKARKQLMTELDVSAGALRVRLHSIRNRLRRCVSACMAESQR